MVVFTKLFTRIRFFGVMYFEIFFDIFFKYNNLNIYLQEFMYSENAFAYDACKRWMWILRMNEYMSSSELPLTQRCR